MSPTFATVFSGIGGADWGLQHAGWEPRWQCEKDPWRRAVLEAHWPGLKRYETAEELPAAGPEHVDLLHAFPPTGDPEWLDLFWPVVEAVRPMAFVLEVGNRCSEALFDWCARLGYQGFGFTLTLEHRAVWMALPLTRIAPIAVCLRGPSGPLLERIAPARFTVALRDGDGGPPRSMPDMFERLKGLPWGWSCVCRPEHPVLCRESSQRLVAVNEASLPDLAEWIGEKLLPLVMARKEEAGV